MSRTYKDKPFKFIDKVEFDEEYDRIEYQVDAYEYALPRTYTSADDKIYTGEVWTYTYRIQKPGVHTKKKRNHTNTHDWWYKRTPSWWTREYMTVPKRAACRNWAKTLTLDNIEEADCPDYGDKPHHYYW